MPQNLQDSITQVLDTLPPAGSPILFEDWRQSVMKSGIESAQPALAVIVKNRLADQRLLPINLATSKLILSEADTKNPDGTPVAHKFVLAVSKKA